MSEQEVFNAAVSGDLSRVQTLVGAHPAWVNAREGGLLDFTALMLAALKGHLSVVEWLAAHGADVNAAEDNGNRTALILAALNGRLPVVECLAAHGADVSARDSDNFTALIHAAATGELPVVEWLAAHGADVNAKNNDEDTTLVVAARTRHLPVVECLVAHDADGTTNDPRLQKVIAEAQHKHSFTVAMNERVALFDTLAASPQCLLNPDCGYTNRDINSMIRALLAQRPTDEELQQWRATKQAAEAAGEHETHQSCVVQK